MRVRGLGVLAATVGTACALCSSTSAADSDSEPIYRHRGFLLRADAGSGYLTASEPTGGPLGTLTVSGVSGVAGLAVGGALFDNFILAAHVYDAVAIGPNVSASATGQSATASSATLTALTIGPEVDYYLMPANVFLTGTVGVSALSASVNNTSISANAGVGGELGIGKEWYVGTRWGLGLLGGVSLADNGDTNGQPITTWTIGLSFTATYNAFAGDGEYEVAPPTQEAPPSSAVVKEEELEQEVSAPPQGPPRDYAQCNAAFGHVDDLARLWAEWFSGEPREPLGGDATTARASLRDAFLRACGKLSDEDQLCLNVSYAGVHKDACVARVRRLAEPAREQIDRLFLRPTAGLPPRLPVRAAGTGWVCAKSLDDQDVSGCYRDAGQCSTWRSEILKSGVHLGPCLPQRRAACFTYRDLLQGVESFDCYATVAACARQRGIAAAKTQDVANVSACGGVD